MKKSVFEADPKDGKEISRILDASTSNGWIDLLYTRRPDAYTSYMKEPGEPRVFAVKKDGAVISTWAQLIRDVYIDGRECKAAYICGLKKDPLYNGSAGIGIKAIKELQRDDIDYYFFRVLSDNPKAKEMFEKAARIFSTKYVTSMKTYIISPKAHIKAPKHSFVFRQARQDDLPMILDFLNREGSKKDLFPVIKTLDTFYNLHIEDFYMLLDSDNILACAALWDSTDYKQYLVRRYNKLVKAARIANPLIWALGFIKLPKENLPLKFPVLSFFVTRNENPDNFFIFLNEIRKEISKKYDMYVFDLPEGHFAREALDKVPNVGFTTMMYRLSFPWSDQEYKNVHPCRLSTETGLL